MNTKLAKKLKALRIDIEFTQKELGEALRLSELYKSPPERIISNYEIGRHIPTKAVLQRYSRYFMLHLKHLEALLPNRKQRGKWKTCKTELGQLLRNARLATGLSRRKMGLKLGIVDFYPSAEGNPKLLSTMIYFWELGQYRPKAEALQRYTERFDVSLPSVEKSNGTPKAPVLPISVPVPISVPESSESVPTLSPGGDTFRDVSEVIPHGESTYYRCTQRNRYGMPIEVERHVYGEHGELIGVEKRRVQ